MGRIYIFKRHVKSGNVYLTSMLNDNWAGHRITFGKSLSLRILSHFFTVFLLLGFLLRSSKAIWFLILCVWCILCHSPSLCWKHVELSLCHQISEKPTYALMQLFFDALCRALSGPFQYWQFRLNNFIDNFFLYTFCVLYVKLLLLGCCIWRTILLFFHSHFPAPGLLFSFLEKFLPIDVSIWFLIFFIMSYNLHELFSFFFVC